MKKGLLVSVLVLFFVLLSGVRVLAAPGDPPVIFGMRNDDVREVQTLLAQTGFYAGDIDGIFGNLTLQALKDFQSSVGLAADGIVESNTYQYLLRAAQEPNRRGRSLVMRASAFTAYDDGSSGYTCRGNFVRKGLAAVDPSVIPLGTRLYIPGYGYAVADDVGSAIKENRIDLAFDSRGEAFQFGVRNVMVYILD